MGSNKKKKIDYKKLAGRLALCAIGSILLAIGTGVFLTPGNVVAGGVSGIAIIVNHYIASGTQNYVDIIVWSLNIFFFIFSIIFLGKRFTIHTLIATFLFPAFLTLIQRTGMFDFIIKELFDGKSNNILIAGVFGGLFVGAGVALTFLGDGSTGGTDILCFIIAKYSPVKQSVSSFISDALIIIAGMACIRNQILASLVGIISALICALMIQIIFVESNSIYICDIVTAKYKELSSYIIKELDGTCTIIDAKGAYHQDKDVKLVRIVIDKRAFVQFKDQISTFDEKAFVTVYSAKKVLGEGFTALYKKREKLVNKK